MYTSNLKQIADDISIVTNNLEEQLNIYEANVTGQLAVIRGSVDSLGRELDKKRTASSGE